MAQYYTLEEASRALGMSVDAFRKKLATEWRNTPRRYPDGATLRFQAREIDELARTLGRHSDADLQPADAPLKLSEEVGGPPAKKAAADAPILVDDSSFVPLTADAETFAPGSKIKKSGSDSDVKLETTGGGVRPVSQKNDVTEEIDLEAEARQARQKSGGKSSKKTFQVTSAPDINISPKTKAVEGSSEFELTLDSDSDEFELKLTDDSDEVALGTGTVTRQGPKSSDSGINLQQPADSGISLEKDDDEVDLSLEPKSGKGPKTAPPTKTVSDESEFELTLDDSGEAEAAGKQKDIFETDFELPAMDEAGSDTGREESDFDLAIDEDDVAAEEESASEVVALEEESPRRRRAVADDDEDLDELEVDDDADLEEEDRPREYVEAVPTAWGNLPAIVMFPCVAVMFLVGLMSYELLRNMWYYHSSVRPTGGLVRLVAGMFGELPTE